MAMRPLFPLSPTFPRQPGRHPRMVGAHASAPVCPPPPAFPAGCRGAWQCARASTSTNVPVVGGSHCDRTRSKCSFRRRWRCPCFGVRQPCCRVRAARPAGQVRAGRHDTDIGGFADEDVRAPRGRHNSMRVLECGSHAAACGPLGPQDKSAQADTPIGALCARGRPRSQVFALRICTLTYLVGRRARALPPPRRPLAQRRLVLGKTPLWLVLAGWRRVMPRPG
ncbi:hypothetical protein HRbin30_03034 [bacterium HR30]|nr:hypothetical protein HRbin30_03034 [bacterium HR30]